MQCNGNVQHELKIVLHCVIPLHKLIISKMAGLTHFCVNFTKVSTGKGMDFIHQARKRVWKMACLGLKYAMD